MLALVAPLISQLRAAAPDDGLPAAPICSATANTLVAHAQSQASPDSSSDSPSDRHFDRCGYCGLLAGHPPLQSAVLLSAIPAARHAPPAPPIASACHPPKRYALTARGPPSARAIDLVRRRAVFHQGVGRRAIDREDPVADEAVAHARAHRRLL
ncbi:DUF2946 domain-containing protein, partial [Burkholderia sp. Tr-20390]|nr:DUF2946 domain-containing protein [Burkholderia sp. Tr-20390]